MQFTIEGFLRKPRTIPYLGKKVCLLGNRNSMLKGMIILDDEHQTTRLMDLDNREKQNTSSIEDRVVAFSYTPSLWTCTQKKPLWHNCFGEYEVKNILIGRTSLPTVQVELTSNFIVKLFVPTIHAFRSLSILPQYGSGHISRDLIILEVGDALRAMIRNSVWTSSSLGGPASVKLTDVFRIARPVLEVSFDAILDYLNQAFVLLLRNDAANVRVS